MSNVGKGTTAGQVLVWTGFGLGWAPYSGTPTSGQVLSWDGSQLVWASPASSLTGYTQTVSPYGTGVGYQTRASGSSGVECSAYGHRAGYLMSSGQYNSVFGAYAGDVTTTGSYNTILGASADPSAASTSYEIVIGYSAVGKGAQQTVIGKTGTGAPTDTWIRGDKQRFGNEASTDKYWFFQNNATSDLLQPGFKWVAGTKLQWSNGGGVWNDFSAGSSLTGTTTGSTTYRTGLGNSAGTQGAYTAYLGYQAGQSSTTAVGNVNIGAFAGRALTTTPGDYNVNIGYGAGLLMDSTSTENVNIGYRAGDNQGSFAYRNVCIGPDAGRGVSVQAQGVYIGRFAGFSTRGDDVICIGTYAGGGGAQGANSSTSSIYIGKYAGLNQKGVSNIGIGEQALAGPVAPGDNRYNVAAGWYCGYSMDTGYYNVLAGYRAGQSITSGYDHVHLGRDAGFTSTTGTDTICIGHSADVAGAADTNEIAIGFGAVGKGSNTTVIGRQAATATTQTWLRGDELRIGNEGATDKYWYFQNSAAATQPCIRWKNSDGRLQSSKNGTNFADLPDRIVYDLHKNLATDSTGVATIIGADYIDASRWPATRTVKFRCILETTNAVAGFEATADLFDTADVLAAGAPAPVTGSQVSTNALVATMVEATVTAAFAGFSTAGVFEARLWIATAGGGNIVTCKSAQLIVEW